MKYCLLLEMYKVETREALAFVSMPVDFDKVLSIFLRISIMEKCGKILSNASIVVLQDMNEKLKIKNITKIIF